MDCGDGGELIYEIQIMKKGIFLTIAAAIASILIYWIYCEQVESLKPLNNCRVIGKEYHQPYVTTVGGKIPFSQYHPERYELVLLGEDINREFHTKCVNVSRERFEKSKIGEKYP